jgi:hypothetical protein
MFAVGHAVGHAVGAACLTWRFDYSVSSQSRHTCRFRSVFVIRCSPESSMRGGATETQCAIVHALRCVTAARDMGHVPDGTQYSTHFPHEWLVRISYFRVNREMARAGTQEVQNSATQLSSAMMARCRTYRLLPNNAAVLGRCPSFLMSDLSHTIVQAGYDVRNSRNQQGFARGVGY